jgi:hypothetical protein
MEIDAVDSLVTETGTFVVEIAIAKLKCMIKFGQT